MKGDIESQSIQNNMSLRKRKNPQSSLPSIDVHNSRKSHEQSHLREHAKLMKKINSVTDYDDDDEQTKELKQMIMKYQIKKNDEMTNFFFRFLIGILLVIVILYTLVVTYEPTSEPTVMNSLVKVLRILLGMKSNDVYLSSSTIVASTSISKATIDDFLIPAFPWQRGTSAKRYLVPAGAQAPVKHMLHESTRLKHERGINIQLYDDDMMREFLRTHSDTCGMHSPSSQGSFSILQKFDELKKLKGNGHKSLWLWCMVYSGATFGYLDIENYSIEMTSNFLRKLSLGTKPYGIANALINPDDENNFDSTAHSPLSALHIPLPIAIVFSSTQKSKVAEGMLQFIINNTYNEKSLHKELKKLVQEENWVLLKAHCMSSPTDRFHGNDNTMAKVCSKSEDEQIDAKQTCCYLVL